MEIDEAKMWITINENYKIYIVTNDITNELVEAIVNPTNNYLRHGAAIAGAICRKGGPIIKEQSAKYIEENGELPIG